VSHRHVFEYLSDRMSIVAIADDAHRTRYGFFSKTLDGKDKEKNFVEKRVVYGFVKYMRDASIMTNSIGKWKKRTLLTLFFPLS